MVCSLLERGCRFAQGVPAGCPPQGVSPAAQGVKEDERHDVIVRRAPTPLSPHSGRHPLRERSDRHPLNEVAPPEPKATPPQTPNAALPIVVSATSSIGGWPMAVRASRK